MEGNTEYQQIYTFLEIDEALLDEAYQQMDTGSDSEEEVEVHPVPLSEVAKNTVLPYYADEHCKTKHLGYSNRKDEVKNTPVIDIRIPRTMSSCFDFVVACEYKHIFALWFNSTQYLFIESDLDELNKAQATPVLSPDDIKFLVTYREHKPHIQPYINNITEVFNKLKARNVEVKLRKKTIVKKVGEEEK